MLGKARQSRNLIEINTLLNSRGALNCKNNDKMCVVIMDVLIVESQSELGGLWKACLERQGMCVTLVQDQEQAFTQLGETAFDIIVLDLILPRGTAFAIADYASYRRPEARVIFVTNSSFFSDGSLFQHSANACAVIRTGTPPEDLAAMVQHYALAG